MIQTFSERTTVILSAIAIPLTILVSSCSGNSEQAAYNLPNDVDFIEIKAENAHIEKKYPGAIEGIVNVDIKAQVTGYLDQIYIKEGEYVTAGQSLFRIKGDLYTEQVSNSRAAYEAALAAEKNAQIEVDKQRPLVEGKVYSELQLQTAEANLLAAKAQVAQARAALGTSQVNAAFTLIKAPVSGYIGRIPNRIGNLVTPADMIPLTVLSDIQQVFVYFSLSEADFISFMKDRVTDLGLNTVELIMADGSAYPHPGEVEIASGNIDKTTGSIPLKAIFPNEHKLLRSGGSGRIVLKKALTDVIVIPMGSVKDIQDRFFVFVLTDNNTIQMKPIEIEGKSGNEYIVRSGLTVGDKIAVNRIDLLSDGMPVVPSIVKTSK